MNGRFSQQAYHNPGDCNMVGGSVRWTNDQNERIGCITRTFHLNEMVWRLKYIVARVFRVSFSRWLFGSLVSLQRSCAIRLFTSSSSIPCGAIVYRRSHVLFIHVNASSFCMFCIKLCLHINARKALTANKLCSHAHNRFVTERSFNFVFVRSLCNTNNEQINKLHYFKQHTMREKNECVRSRTNFSNYTS